MKKITSSVGGIALAVCLLGAATAPAFADQEVSVGRVDVQLPGKGWVAVVVPDEGRAISGLGSRYMQKAESRFLVHLREDAVVDAIIFVRANDSGIGRGSGLSFSGYQCGGSDTVYAEGEASGPSALSFKCMKVYPAQPADSWEFIKNNREHLFEKKGWKVAGDMFVVTAKQLATTGAFADVHAYVRPLVASPDEVQAEGSASVPKSISAASLQWGRELQKAVTDSVYSLGGDLNVPVMVFESEAVAEPGNGGEPALPAAQPADANPANAAEPGKG